jgi:NADP-dependent 3-hydroxy acid dehydrogenase YdfG
MKQKGISNFSQQRIWIIGASSGIGEACAKAFFKAGAKVALSSRRVERLTALASNQDALVLPLDVTHKEQVDSAYKTLLESWGGIDLLLFVSGVYTPLRADNFDFDVAQKTIDANSVLFVFLINHTPQQWCFNYNNIGCFFNYIITNVMMIFVPRFPTAQYNPHITRCV